MTDAEFIKNNMNRNQMIDRIKGRRAGMAFDGKNRYGKASRNHYRQKVLHL